MPWDLEQVSKVVGSGGLGTALLFGLKHFVLSAPQQSQNRKDATAALIANFEERLKACEAQIRDLMNKLADRDRENTNLKLDRGALISHHDQAVEELHYAAAMCESRETVGAVTLARWKAISKADVVLENVKREREAEGRGVEIIPTGAVA